MVETVLGNISPITEINLSEKETWVLRTVTFVTTVDAVKVVQCAAFVRSQHVRGRPVWIGINRYTRAPVHLDRPNDRDSSPNYHWECYEGTGRGTDRASLPALRELAVQKGRRAPPIHMSAHIEGWLARLLLAAWTKQSVSWPGQWMLASAFCSMVSVRVDLVGWCLRLRLELSLGRPAVSSDTARRVE